MTEDVDGQQSWMVSGREFLDKMAYTVDDQLPWMVDSHGFCYVVS